MSCLRHGSIQRALQRRGGRGIISPRGGLPASDSFFGVGTTRVSACEARGAIRVFADEGLSRPGRWLASTMPKQPLPRAAVLRRECTLKLINFHGCSPSSDGGARRRHGVEKKRRGDSAEVRGHALAPGNRSVYASRGSILEIPSDLWRYLGRSRLVSRVFQTGNREVAQGGGPKSARGACGASPPSDRRVRSKR